MKNKDYITLSPRILIFEPEATGHQMEYVRYILSGIAHSLTRAQVTVLTSEVAANHPNFRRAIDEFGQIVKTRVISNIARRNYIFALLGKFYERQWRYAEQLQRGLKEIGIDNIDFVLIPYMEELGLLQLALRPKLCFGRPWGTIAIGIRFHHRRCGINGPMRAVDIMQNILFRRVVRDPSLAFLGTPNAYLVEYESNPKVIYCPEPCTQPKLSSSEHSRVTYGIRAKTFVVLVFGFLDHRKCIDVLLEAAASIRDELDLTIFLAGTQHKGDLTKILSSDAARKLRDHESLVESNRYIMNGRDVDPFGAADVCWVFYESAFVLVGSVLVWSGLAKRPVISRRQGVMGRLVDEHNLGITLGSDAPETVAAALRRLATDPDLRREMGENGARAFARNTPENFARPITEGIKRALVARG